MLKHLAALLLSCSVLGAHAADPACTPGSAFEPASCPLRLPPIRRITVLRNAAKSPLDTDPAVRCDSFRVTVKTVRRYFAQARAVNADDAHHTLDWSSCFASGTLVLEDGRKGTWWIEQFRAGSLKLGHADAQPVYCPGCRAAPFRR